MCVQRIAPGIDQLLAEHGVSSTNPFSRTRLASMACPSLPTCGLALAESERVLPRFLTQIEDLLTELGLADQELIIRNDRLPQRLRPPLYGRSWPSWAKRPTNTSFTSAENEGSTRLNRIYKDSVKGDDLIARTAPPAGALS